MTCYTGVIEGNKLYTVHEGLGLLMEYDLQKFSYKILCSIFSSMPQDFVRVKGLFIDSGIIYIILLGSWKVIEYYIDSKCIKINGSSSDYLNKQFLVEKITCYEKKIWLLPCYIGDTIKIFDFEKKTYIEKKAIGQYLIEEGKNINLDIFAEYETTKEGIVYAIVYESAYVVSINMVTEEYRLYDIGKDKKLSSINFDGKNYWLSYFDSNAIEKWSPLYGVLETYDIPQIKVDNRRQPIRMVYERKNKIYIIPTFMPDIIVLDKEKEEMPYICLKGKQKRIYKNGDRFQFLSSLMYKNMVILLPHAVNEFVLIDLETGLIKNIESRLTKFDIRRYIINPQLQYGMTNEIFGWGIKEFINDIVL